MSKKDFKNATQGNQHVVRGLLFNSNLCTAIRHADYRRVTKLIAQGADVNGSDHLYHAISRGDVAMVTLLLQKGADPNLGQDYKELPIWALVHDTRCDQKSAVKILDMLLKAGLDVKAAESKGCGLIAACCENRDPFMVDLMIRTGCDINAVDKWRQTPLILAADNNEVTSALYLIYAGAQVGVKRSNGDTARSISLRKGHVKIVEAIDNQPAILEELRQERIKRAALNAPILQRDIKPMKVIRLKKL